MLRARLIPCLLVHQRGLVKTQRFGSPKYVGDPLNAVRIFNEKEVDELIVLDIDATREGRDPDYRLIEALASECRMPFCYGGGITSVEQAHRIIQLGVEKVALSSILATDPGLVARLAARIGSQSVVAVLDARRSTVACRYEVWTHSATRTSGREVGEFASELETNGVGELVINAIDRDGTREGYDRTLIRRVREVVSVPITALGGAASLADIGELIDEHGVIGAAAGSLFVFKGVYRAVLINYPNRSEKSAVLSPHL